MHTTGILLSRLVGSAVAGMLILAVGFVLGNASPGDHGPGPLAHLVSDVAPYLGLFILAAEAVAMVLLIVGIARWPLRIMRSPRWVLSALGIVLVAVVILVVVYIALVVAISHP